MSKRKKTYNARQEEKHRREVLSKMSTYSKDTTPIIKKGDLNKDSKVDYGFTIEQIQYRVLADCNRKRLKEHRQCDYCHLIFDCKYYESQEHKTLCQYLDSVVKKED